METTTLDQHSNETPKPASARKPVTKPDYSEEPQVIGRFTTRADYPECLLGAHVDIKGFAGVVVEIVNQSIRVLSEEGILQSFNFNRLKTLYSPPTHTEAMPSSRPVAKPQAETAPEPEPEATAEEPAIEETPSAPAIEPDYSVPARKIEEFAGQPEFPECVLGVHVDINEFNGVVIEIVKGSLKIQSPDGIMRSYNAAVLTKIFAKG